MPSETAERYAVNAISDKLSVNRLIEEYNKEGSSDVIKEEIEKKVASRDTCPECDGSFMYDAKKDVFYCPMGCFDTDDL